MSVVEGRRPTSIDERQHLALVAARHALHCVTIVLGLHAVEVAALVARPRRATPAILLPGATWFLRRRRFTSCELCCSLWLPVWTDYSTREQLWLQLSRYFSRPLA